MGSIGSLKHLDEKDKQDILFEIRFFFSQKGFIDGISLYERMEGVLNTKGDLTSEEKTQYRSMRRRK